MPTVYLPKTIQSHSIEWDVADDMSGWVAWLPDEVGVAVSTYSCSKYEYVDTPLGELKVKQTRGGRKWIGVNCNGHSM